MHDNQYYVKPEVVWMNETNLNPYTLPASLDDNSSHTQAIKHSQKPFARHKAYKISNSTQKPVSRDLDGKKSHT